MFQTRIYSSQSPLTQKALVEIGTEYHRDNFSADFALIFSSIHHANQGHHLNQALSDVFDQIPFIGWLGTSIYHEQSIPEWQPALVVVLFKGVQAHVRTTGPKDYGSHLGISLLADSPTGGCRFLTINSEPIDHSGLLATLDEQLVPLIGGISLSPKNMPGVVISSANQDETATCAGIASVSGINMVATIAHGTHLLGPKHKVTASQNNLLLELDNAPALDILLDDLPQELHDELAQLGNQLFVGMSTPDGDEWLMRHIAGIDPQSGVLILTDTCAPDTELAFFMREADAARQNIQDAVHNLKESLGSETPATILLFNCTSRDEALLGAPLFDVQTIKETFLDIPIAGFAGGGELVTVGRNSHLFQHCSIVVAILEEPVQ